MCSFDETFTKPKNRLQLRNRFVPRPLLVLLGASVAILILALFESSASACTRDALRQPAAEPSKAVAGGAAGLASVSVRAFEHTTSPQIMHSGYRAPSNLRDRESSELSRLWLQLASVPTNARYVVLEAVWGTGPRALSDMWGKIFPIHNRHVFIYPAWSGQTRDQAFTLGYRLRFVFDDGSLSAPSLPTFVSNSGDSATESSPRSHQVLLVLCCLALFGLWIVYRRDSDPVHRIRVAAGVALVSVLFLATAPALSWLRVEDPGGRLDPVDCQLGDEAQCATYVPDAGPNPLSTTDTASERRFEVVRWMSASSALRIGLILCLVLLMPTLIWLLVAPTLRVAQSAMVFGASAAGYTLLAALCYRLTVPSWMSVQSSHALELTIITAGNIVVAAGMVIFWSFRHLEDAEGTLPAAHARIRETPGDTVGIG